VTSAAAYHLRLGVLRMQWLLFPVAIVAGTLMVVQAACNGTLEKVLDRPAMVGIIGLSAGLMTLVIVGTATGQLAIAGNGRVMQGPWWAWVGGVCGAVSLLSQPIAVPRLGAATYIGLFVTASSVMSVAFDHFGWLGLTQHPAGIGRVLGCALMVIGIGLVSIF
jgi:transporter family-2 protein